ncbi:MAG: hypothetical protein ABJB76_05845 [Candidatus Nitrosocosmicus sp.]
MNDYNKEEYIIKTLSNTVTTVTDLKEDVTRILYSMYLENA